MVEEKWVTLDERIGPSTYYGVFILVAKRLVKFLIDNQPDMAVQSIAKDEAESYDATLKWAPCDDALFHVYTSGSSVYLRWENLAGKAIAVQNYSDWAMRSSYDSNAKVYYCNLQASFVSLGGCFNRLTAWTDDDGPESGYGGYTTFNWALASTIKKKVFFLEASRLWDTRISDNSIQYIYPNTYQYTLVEGQDTPVASSLEQPKFYVQYVAPKGNYLLIPVCTGGRIDSLKLNLSVLLWGGLYTLYHLALRDSSYSTTVMANQLYIVNGETHRSLSTTLYILEPHPYKNLT